MRSSSPPSPARARYGAVLAVVLLCVLSLLELAACSRTAPLIEGDAHPPMWEAVRGDTRLILIGSVHQLPPTLDWQDLRVKRAVSAADALILELSPEESAKASALFARMSRDESVPPLVTRIGDRDAETVESQLSAQGLTHDDVAATESWAITLLLSNIASAALGLSGDNGVETVLTRQFTNARKPVTGLETSAAQLGIFNAIAPNTQSAMLRRAIADQATSRDTTVALLRAWAAGDVAQITRLVDAEMARTPELAEPLVLSRNRAWAAQLAARPTTGATTTLIAVGTGHLIGPEALPALLAARGFTVRRIVE